MNILVIIFSTLLMLSCNADTEVKLVVSGKNFKQEKTFSIEEVRDKKITKNISLNQKYKIALEYKKLPSNRSFPKNIGISFYRSEKKIGYLFLAINSLKYLKRIGNFGVVFGEKDQLVKFDFIFSPEKSGRLNLESLKNERFFQDTLLQKKNFQMIRPVILSKTNKVELKKGFPLDSHPYFVEYELIDQRDGVVQFHHNFYKTKNKLKTRIMSFYFNAHSKSEIREAMYAIKSFDFKDAPAKLVFYPALGQTEPKGKGI